MTFLFRRKIGFCSSKTNLQLLEGVQKMVFDEKYIKAESESFYWRFSHSNFDQHLTHLSRSYRSSKCTKARCLKYLTANKHASHNYCSNGAVPALNYVTDCIELMREERQNKTMDELVDILAQKTERFTQLLVYKDFGTEYKECKEAIQEILAEIELRKENVKLNTGPIRNQSNSAIQ
jgi:carboxypeptidase C (cathepsin A)